MYSIVCVLEASVVVDIEKVEDGRAWVSRHARILLSKLADVVAKGGTRFAAALEISGDTTLLFEPKLVLEFASPEKGSGISEDSENIRRFLDEGLACFFTADAESEMALERADP